MSQNRNSRNFSFTHDQRVLLDLYTNFYNQTTRQLDSLHELQNEIRENISQIIGLNANIHESNYRNTSSANATNNNNNNNQNSNSNSNYRHAFRHNNTRNHEHRHAHNRHNNNSEPALSTRRVVIEGVPYLVEIPSSHNENAFRFGSTYNPSPEYNRTVNNLLRSFFERNIVAPTREQINNSTRILRFADIENPLNNSCPVTLDRFESDSSVRQIIHCRHIFTPSGIDSWLQSNVRCPVCRYDIREYVPPPITSESREVNEESKEDSTVEESKSDSENTNHERNSIPTNTTFANIDIQNTLSSITENILGQLLNTESINLDPAQNSIFYDASNNQFVFEGFIRRR
jgi:hypothetical protein